jgi:hypothetical protein
VSHDLRGKREEVRTAFHPHAILIHELQVGLVKQCSGVERLVPPPALALTMSQESEFLVEDRKEGGKRRTVAGAQLLQALRNGGLGVVYPKFTSTAGTSTLSTALIRKIVVRTGRGHTLVALSAPRPRAHARPTWPHPMTNPVSRREAFNHTQEEP